MSIFAAIYAVTMLIMLASITTYEFKYNKKNSKMTAISTGSFLLTATLEYLSIIPIINF